ncbi:MAG: DUF1573 domain-containing protein [candidate division Zixibacteria bacterium]|nr:DUF1573 domain-containing protein [candidate division Zixibacteria bacterium]
MSHRLLSRLIAIAGVAALAAGPAFAQHPPAQPPPQTDQAAPVGSKLPRVAVSAEEFDFGRVPQGSTISHVFWIKNIGEDTLRITDVKPG